MEQLTHLIQRFGIKSPLSDPLYLVIFSFGLLFILFISLYFIKKLSSKNKNKEIPSSSSNQNNMTHESKSWKESLYLGLSKTRNSLQGNLSQLFLGKKQLDQDLLDKLHEILFRADIGPSTADKLLERIKGELQDKEPSWQDVQEILQAKILEIISKTKDDKPDDTEFKPKVILLVGVNGVGKTTTIGKLASNFLDQGKEVLLCAADTFRAAAIDQLKIWGERTGIKVIAHKQGSDPAAVAYDAVKAALARKSDILLIDTAGRLHSKHELMSELNKINRTIGKDLPGAPHETWLVIDSTTGQNAIQQVKAFNEVVNLSGLVVTKLDGTAKGGVIIGILDQFSFPIKYIGVGEKAADLHEFHPKEFCEALFAEDKESLPST